MASKKEIRNKLKELLAERDKEVRVVRLDEAESDYDAVLGKGSKERAFRVDRDKWEDYVDNSDWGEYVESVVGEMIEELEKDC